jgi:peptidyl-prolyl cis-trans isomerase C
MVHVLDSSFQNEHKPMKKGTNYNPMKAKPLITVLTFFLWVTLVGTLHAQKAEQQTATAGKAAIVNGVVIPEEEVNRGLLYYQQRLLATKGQAIRPDMIAEAKKMVLENLIDMQLLYQESVRKGMVVDDAQVNEQFDRMKQQYPNEQAFKEGLAEEKITEDTVKSKIKMTMAVHEFVGKEFGGNLNITEADAKAFYDQHPEYFTQPESIRASEIVIKVDPKADAAKKEEARKKLEDIQKRVQKGENFAVLAKEFSQSASAAQGGDLGVIPRGRMPKAFDDAAFSMKPGEVSGIVEIDLGFQLIKVQEKTPEKVVPFKDVEERIQQHLKDQKVKQRVDEYLKELKKTAKIERISAKGAD